MLPSLALNYLGQGALLMRDPAAIENPFYRLFPDGWLIPALVLATLAAIIASQAVISGAYSMTHQAIQLGFLPRMSVRHTSAREAGQIYMPAVNWLLLAGVVAAVVGFGSSSALAGAYGIAVTLTMLITTLLTYFVVRDGCGSCRLPLALGATAFFLVIDALLVVGCAVKFFDGGWFPLALGALLFAVMTHLAARPRAACSRSIRATAWRSQPFVASLEPAADCTRARALRSIWSPTRHRAAGAAAQPEAQPGAARAQRDPDGGVPRCAVGRRGRARPGAGAGHGFWRVVRELRLHGDSRCAAGAAAVHGTGLAVPLFETSYFLSRRDGGACARAGELSGWRERLFVAMSRNASSVAEYFLLPDNAVVELGTRVQIYGIAAADRHAALRRRRIGRTGEHAVRAADGCAAAVQLGPAQRREQSHRDLDADHDLARPGDDPGPHDVRAPN